MPEPRPQPAPRGIGDQSQVWRTWRGPLTVGITIAAAVALSLELTKVIYPIPGPTRTFVALSAEAGALVIGGLVFLIVLIPVAASKSDVRTELYSVRAAYLCVVAGLILLGIVAVGAVVAQVMLTVGRH